MRKHITKIAITPYINKKKNKAIRCIETNSIYDPITCASAELGISPANIVHALKGRTETAGGYHWEYVE